jgi:1-acyl-sn-glycerol-3-phosphate acyltransferase
VTQPKVGPGELRGIRAIGRVLGQVLSRITVTGEVPATGPVLLALNHTALVDDPMVHGLLPRPVAYLAVRSGAPVMPVACHGTGARRGWAFLRRHSPAVMVALGPPLRLPTQPASRRTVAAAADEIHRALVAHVAVTRPRPEREQP